MCDFLEQRQMFLKYEERLMLEEAWPLRDEVAKEPRGAHERTSGQVRWQYVNL